LRVALNPKDEISWDRIKKNMGIRRTQKVEEFLKDNNVNKIEPFDLIEQLLEASTYLDKFDPDDEDDYRRIENMEELKSVATKFKDLGDFLENIALVQQEYSQQEKQKDKLKDNAVRLMTIHASKGLEFENVFLVGMEEGLLPHAQNIEDKEKLEEERRLCYVGMTRAKKRLYLTFASRRMYFGQTNYNAPSQFLLDIPDHLLNDNSFRKEDDIWEDDFDDDEDDW
jgi:DNA helicase-2/ATP-dependent DNA helicase PcrA